MEEIGKGKMDKQNVNNTLTKKKVQEKGTIIIDEKYENDPVILLW